MASSGAFYEIKLLESDVPGAKLRCHDLKSNSVEELKRWLACRALTTAGKKDELVQRFVLMLTNIKAACIINFCGKTALAINSNAT